MNNEALPIRLLLRSLIGQTLVRPREPKNNMLPCTDNCGKLTRDGARCHTCSAKLVPVEFETDLLLPVVRK